MILSAVALFGDVLVGALLLLERNPYWLNWREGCTSKEEVAQ
jgi:hypothetical protein